MTNINDVATTTAQALEPLVEDFMTDGKMPTTTVGVGLVAEHFFKSACSSYNKAMTLAGSSPHKESLAGCTIILVRLAELANVFHQLEDQTYQSWFSGYERLGEGSIFDALCSNTAAIKSSGAGVPTIVHNYAETVKLWCKQLGIEFTQDIDAEAAAQPSAAPSAES
jgi:hypothetical protein